MKLFYLVVGLGILFGLTAGLATGSLMSASFLLGAAYLVLYTNRTTNANIALVGFGWGKLIPPCVAWFMFSVLANLMHLPGLVGIFLGALTFAVLILYPRAMEAMDDEKQSVPA